MMILPVETFSWRFRKYVDKSLASELKEIDVQFVQDVARSLCKEAIYHSWKDQRMKLAQSLHRTSRMAKDID